MKRRKRQYLLLYLLLIFGSVGIGNHPYSISSCSAADIPHMVTRSKSPPVVFTQTKEVQAYHFNPTGKPGDAARIQIDNLGNALQTAGKTGPKEFSISIWFNLRLHTMPSTLISYFATDTQANVMRIAVERDKLYFMHEYKTTKEYTMAHQFEPFKWYHVCLIMREISVIANEVGSYSIALYFADYKLTEFEFIGRFPMTGSLCIGQDFKNVKAAAPAEESLIGRLSPSLYPDAFFSVDVQALYQCLSLVRDPLTLTWQSFGQVAGISVDICKERSAKGILIPQKFEVKREARDLCAMINTDLAIPQTSEENRNLARMLSLAPVCRGLPVTVFGRGWLGLSYNALTASKAIVEWGALTSFISSQVDSSKLQKGDVILTSNREWNTDTSVEACPLCYGNAEATLSLFGFCDDGDDDDMPLMFYPRTDNDGILYFYSSNGLQIRKKNTWELFDNIANSIVAQIDEDFFLGRKEWNIRHPVSYCKVNAEPVKRMSLSACLSTEFTCDNGQCIPMEYRCNSVYDCKDGKDEDCNNLKIPEDYEKRNPPPSRPLQVAFNLSLAKVSALDINAETLQVTIAFKMFWKDSRLGFNNLLNDTKRNSFTHYLDDIWTPKIQMTNEDVLSEPADPQVDLLVMKAGNPSKIDEGYFYIGSENFLVYSLKKSSHISCDFYLTKYPFDVQDCWVNMTLTNLPGILIQLEGNLSTEIGDQTLTDYEVQFVKLDIIGNLLSAQINLKRVYAFHWMSTYIPTILLHILGYASLYLSASHFYARGSVSIASLVMLIILYSGMLSYLPKSSHIKFYDVWYFFSFLFLFLIIMVHLITNNLEEVKAPSNPVDLKLTKVQPLKSKGKEFPTLFVAEGDKAGGAKTLSSDNDFILFVAMIALPVIYFLFQFSYWVALAI